MYTRHLTGASSDEVILVVVCATIPLKLVGVGGGEEVADEVVEAEGWKGVNWML
jgi:hypothetical protein